MGFSAMLSGAEFWFLPNTGAIYDMFDSNITFYEAGHWSTKLLHEKS